MQLQTISSFLRGTNIRAIYIVRAAVILTPMIILFTQTCQRTLPDTSHNPASAHKLGRQGYGFKYFRPKIPRSSAPLLAPSEAAEGGLRQQEPQRGRRDHVKQQRALLRLLLRPAQQILGSSGSVWYLFESRIFKAKSLIQFFTK